MDNIVSWVGVFIALGSLAVSAITLIRGSRMQQRVVRIEEQREQERRSQSLQASLRPELRGGGSSRLCLINHGAAEARNIRVEMDGKPLAQHPTTVEGDPMPIFVGPYGEICCSFAASSALWFHDIGPSFKIKITWDDDFGQNRTYWTTLTMRN